MTALLYPSVVVYTITFLILLPLIGQRLPHSTFFLKSKNLPAQVFNYNRRRLASASEYLSTLPTNDGKLIASARIAIGVVGVSRQIGRDDPQYLTQVMAQLHESIARHGAQNETSIFICNVDSQRYEELGKLAPYFHVTHKPFNVARQVTSERHEKEKQDYVFCLETAARLSSRYVLLLQDDALPRRDFYATLDYILRSRLERTVHAGEDHAGFDDWVWIKLNFPDTLANFHRSPYFACEWVALSITGASIITLLYHMSPSKHTRLISIFIISLVYLLLVTWAVGRPYFLPLYGLSKHFTKLTPGTSCCLTAVLYPQPRVPALVTYLKSVTCKADFPLDFALDAYRDKVRLRQYLAVPNLFSHIGYISALHRGPNEQMAYTYLFE